MYYKINTKLWIVRLEYFGGILLNRDTGEKYELDFENTLVLICLDDGYSINASKKIVESVLDFSDFTFNIDLYIKLGIIHLINLNSHKQIKEEIQKLKNALIQVKAKKYLSAPIEVSIYPISKCQLTCNFCYYKDKRHFYAESEKAYKWKNVIKNLYDNGVLFLSVLGGEPTLYPEIDTLLQYVEKLGFRTTITTNGVNIKKSTFDLIANSKYITPTISLQSLNSKLNKKLTGVSSEIVVKTIEDFINAGKIPRVNTVMTEQSIEQVIELVDCMSKLGVEEFGLNILMNFNEKNFSNRSFYDYRVINESILKHIEEKNYNMNYSLQGCLLYSAYSELENPVESEFDRLQYGCEAGQTKIEIMPNGDVYPCVAFSTTDFKYISAFESDIVDIWNNAPYLKEIRDYIMQDSNCKKCNFYNFCNGGCSAYNLCKNKSFTKKGDERCQILLEKK